jgi:hypothetical protein
MKWRHVAVTYITLAHDYKLLVWISRFRRQVLIPRINDTASSLWSLPDELHQNNNNNNNKKLCDAAPPILTFMINTYVTRDRYFYVRSLGIKAWDAEHV